MSLFHFLLSWAHFAMVIREWELQALMSDFFQFRAQFLSRSFSVSLLAISSLIPLSIFSPWFDAFICTKSRIVYIFIGVAGSAFYSFPLSFLVPIFPWLSVMVPSFPQLCVTSFVRKRSVASQTELSSKR